MAQDEKQTRESTSPPAKAEIEEAREWVEHVWEQRDPAPPPKMMTVLRALDALAREPGLEARINDRQALFEVTDANYSRAKDRIAALEAELAERRTAAVAVAEADGMIDGAHHKQWVIDQMLRALLGNEYDAWVAVQNSDPDYDPWDVGIAP